MRQYCSSSARLSRLGWIIYTGHPPHLIAIWHPSRFKGVILPGWAVVNHNWFCPFCISSSPRPPPTSATPTLPFSFPLNSHRGKKPIVPKSSSTMPRWHLESCTVPNVVLHNRVPTCRACKASLDLEGLIDQQIRLESESGQPWTVPKNDPIGEMTLFGLLVSNIPDIETKKRRTTTNNNESTIVNYQS